MKCDCCQKEIKKKDSFGVCNKNDKVIIRCINCYFGSDFPNNFPVNLNNVKGISKTFVGKLDR